MENGEWAFRESFGPFSILHSPFPPFS